MIISEINPEGRYELAFDISKGKPGCVLLQSACGCNSKIAHLFDTDKWLLAPTDDLKPYKLTGQELIALTELVNSGEFLSIRKKT